MLYIPSQIWSTAHPQPVYPFSQHHENYVPKLVLTKNNRLRATIFPFVIQDGIELQYNDSKDGPYDLPVLRVEVYNGTLIPSNPFPGLYINNKNKTCIEAIGPVEDLQLWIESGRNSSDYSTKIDEYVSPGGGIRYIPPYYDWIGTASVQISFFAPNHDDGDDGDYDNIMNRLYVGTHVSTTALATVKFHVHPFLELKLNITTSDKNNIVTSIEDEPFYPFHKRSGSDKVTVLFEGVSRNKIIQCFLEASVGIFDHSQINGTISILNQTLAGIKYVPKADYNGNVMASISCHNDEDDQHDQASFEIDVLPVNDQPTIMLHSDKVFETWEDMNILLGPYANLFIVDVDAYESEKSLLAVDLIISKGRATLHLPSPDLLGRLYVTSNSPSHLRLLGHIDEVNLALQYVSLSFPQDWYGSGTLSVTCTDMIEFGNSHPMEVIYDHWLSDYVDFLVKSVNDGPKIRIKASAFENIHEGDEIF